jgi:hypothetical protein
MCNKDYLDRDGHIIDGVGALCLNCLDKKYNPKTCPCGGTYVQDDIWASRRVCKGCGDWYDLTR